MQRKVKNQRLGATGYVWAFAALTASPHARAHYDRRRAVGDGHPAALRNPVLPIPEPVAPLPSDRPDIRPSHHSHHGHLDRSVFSCPRRTRCSGLRNCNVNPDDLRPDRPDLGWEPQQARGIPRNFQLDETAGTVTEVCVRGVVATDGVNVV